MALETILYEKVNGNTVNIVRDTVTHVIDHFNVVNDTADQTELQVRRISNRVIVWGPQLFGPGSHDISVPGNVVWDTNKNTLTATYFLEVRNPA